MRLGVGLGPFYASQRIGLPRRRYRRGGSGNWLGWLVILAPIGWLMGQCDGHPHGYQPTQIAPPLAPMTTTAPTPRPLTGTERYCLAHPNDPDCTGMMPTTTTAPTWTPGMSCPLDSPKPDGTCNLEDWGFQPGDEPQKPPSRQQQCKALHYEPPGCAAVVPTVPNLPGVPQMQIA
jgi:hypothetical protein